MASYDYELLVDNRSATYPSWPLIFIELEANMPAIDGYSFLSGSPAVMDIHRIDSPNFGRRIFVQQITLSPAPTALAPVRVYIDAFNRQVYVDPESSHAQAGELLQVLYPSSRFFDLLPGIINEINIVNAPANTGMTFGVRWRKAYSG